MGFAPRELGHRDNYRLYQESTVSTTRTVLSQKWRVGWGEEQGQRKTPALCCGVQIILVPKAFKNEGQ